MGILYIGGMQSAYDNIDKIYFSVNYPTKDKQLLVINYKANTNMRSLPVVSVLTKRLSQNDVVSINNLPGFTNLKNIFNILKTNSSNNIDINITPDNIEINNNNEVNKKINDEIAKLKENIGITVTIGLPTDGADTRLGGAKSPKKQSSSTTKRRKKRSSKTRRR